MKILILIDNLTNGTLGAKDFHARFRLRSFCRKKKLWYLGKAPPTTTYYPSSL